MGLRRRVRDGEEYEVYVADVLRRQGFRDIRYTARTGDYGVDLLARHGRHWYAVQCKYYSGAVGGAAVQEAVAGMAYYGCERALVVTNSYLTPSAHNLARANGVDVLEHIGPEHLSFLERRAAWELVLFAVLSVVYGLILFRLRETGGLTLRAAAVWAGLCYPLPYLLAAALRLLWRRARTGAEEDSVK